MRDLRRGARVAGSGLRRWWWGCRAVHSRALTLAGCPLSAAEECRHFKLIGTTGAGKSTAIRELLAAALARGDRAVIADPDGSYCAHFLDRWRGDAVLGPFEGGARWDPFSELREVYDAEHVAGALVATSADAGAAEWREYARTLLAALLGRCAARGGGLSDLWRLLAVAPPQELRTLLAGTAAEPFVEPENARMFGSIRAIAVAAARGLEFVRQQRTHGFCIRDWVCGGRGVLFIPYRARQIAALRGLIAAWMGLAIFEALSGQEEHDQRLWFIVDELDALGAIHGLKDALARLRKFGGRCVLGFQSIAQVSGTYGPAEAQTIVENCGNTLILRASASEGGGTARFASQLIGERERLRRQVVRGRDCGGGLFAAARRSTQVSEQALVEAAVMPSELEQLPDLTGYLRTACSPVWYRVRLRR